MAFKFLSSMKCFGNRLRAGLPVEKLHCVVRYLYSTLTPGRDEFVLLQNIFFSAMLTFYFSK